MNNLHRIGPLLNQLDQIRLQLFRLIDHQAFTEDFDKEIEEIKRCTMILAEQVQVGLNRLAIDRRVTQIPEIKKDRRKS